MVVAPHKTDPYKTAIVTAFAATTLGAKLWLIARFGNATPFFDEWDALAELFRGYETGSLTLAHLFAPHNEHRLVTARLMSLGLYLANDGWDPLLQMVVNAALHVAFATSLLVVLGKRLNRTAFTALAGLLLAMVAVPFGWESVLLSVQTHFYATLLFGFWAVVLLVRQPGLSALRLSGIATAVLAFFSLASGALAFAAAAVLIAARRVLGVERGWQPWAMVVALLAGFGVCWILIPWIPENDALKATSPAVFADRFIFLSSWPMWPLYVTGMVLVNGPIVRFTWRTLRRPPPADNVAWLILALALWTALELAALAYGRAGAIRSSRYLDILAVTVTLNFVAAAIMSTTRFQEIMTALWLCFVAVGLARQGIENLPNEVSERGATALQQEKNVRAFLATGQFPPDAKGEDLSLPYPRPERLQSLLSNPTVRSFLPSNLQSPGSQQKRPADRLAWLRNALLAIGPALTGIGFIAFAAAALSGWWLGRRGSASRESAKTWPQASA